MSIDIVTAINIDIVIAIVIAFDISIVIADIAISNANVFKTLTTTYC